MNRFVLKNTFIKVYIHQYSINIFCINKKVKVVFWRPFRCPKRQFFQNGNTSISQLFTLMYYLFHDGYKHSNRSNSKEQQGNALAPNLLLCPSPPRSRQWRLPPTRCLRPRRLSSSQLTCAIAVTSSSSTS
jgi:hypothetical protein